MPSAAVAACWSTGRGGVSACQGGLHLPSVNRHLWKHNLSATTVADGYKACDQACIRFFLIRWLFQPSNIVFEKHVRLPPPSVNKTSHSGFETQRRCHQKSKTGLSVAPQKGLKSSKKFFFKKLCLKEKKAVKRTGPGWHKREGRKSWCGNTEVNTIVNVFQWEVCTSASASLSLSQQSLSLMFLLCLFL